MAKKRSKKKAPKKTTKKPAKKSKSPKKTKKAPTDAELLSAEPEKSGLKPILLVLGALVLLFIVIKTSTQSPAEMMENTVMDHVSTDGMRVLGSPDAPVTIVEYSDFQCPFCARAAQDAVAEMKKTLIADGKVKLVFKHFPLPSHPQAQKAAEASECAGDQEKFWEMHDLIFEKQHSMSVDVLKGHAKELGLDTATFNECLDSGKYAGKVAADTQEGIELGVTGTPAFFVDGFLVTGAQPFSVFNDLVEAALAGEDLGAAQANNAQNPDQQLKDSSSDPEITITIINDPDCEICDPSQVTDLLTGKLFTTATVNEVDYQSDEGMALIEQFNLIGLPAYVFDSTVTQGANYPSVADAFVQSGEQYLLAPQLVGMIKMIQTPDIEFAHTKGDPNAPITIVEYSDFECPFCAKFYVETLGTIESEFVDTGLVKIAFKHFPLPGHSNAAKAAEASECAADQNMFWEMHDLLFANQRSLSDEKYTQLAEELGLDMASFEECMSTSKYADKVTSDLESGIQFGISGTPSFFVNDVVLSGAVPYPVFQELIDGMVQ